ncbi:unnamed protein product [Prorocentrum cordatum]|uniref:Hexosyltransferase n=1 Tax=Prorocentrum cordatum TaxID=2364126 RepID=A0ABN9S194_9DINO|nr:unnamed protein product [Polarella glacialis]
MVLSLLHAFVLLGLATQGRSVTIRAHETVEGNSGPSSVLEAAADKGRLTEAWKRKVSHVLQVENMTYSGNATAIVTYAGKKDLTYIDGAVMLGMSVRKHVPGFPMVAIVVEGMKPSYQQLLRDAGWAIAAVPNWEADYCGPKCDLQFLGRWHDSFEKRGVGNAFRLPFQRVLFLDADTYVFQPKLRSVIEMYLPDGHIAMAMDGCKDVAHGHGSDEYNSGVMVYSPSLELFMQMLDMVSHRERNDILDQNIINEAYRGKVVELHRNFNCVDIIGVQPGQRTECQFRCGDDAVVSHFTGHPKPTAGKRMLLELIRRPTSPRIACTNTNFGSCAKWSQFYCDMRQHSERLSSSLQADLEHAGPCCHTPFDPSKDRLSCKDCPAELSFVGAASCRGCPGRADVNGAFVKTTIKGSKLHGGKPIYMRIPRSQGRSPYRGPAASCTTSSRTRCGCSGTTTAPT